MEWNQYIRKHRTYFHVASPYSISKSACYRNIRWIEDILIKHPDFALPGRKTLDFFRNFICLLFSKGKRHDLRLFKESKTNVHPKTKVITDTGYQGLGKIHFNTTTPKKKTKKNPFTKEDKKNNQRQSSERVLND